MTIALITKKEYKRLLDIQKKHPKLTYQNEGYDYPKRTDWSENDNKAFKEVEDLLKEHINYFREFNHFKISKRGLIRIRFQYNYNDHFSGVGYIDIIELYKGFYGKKTIIEE